MDNTIILAITYKREKCVYIYKKNMDDLERIMSVTLYKKFSSV